MIDSLDRVASEVRGCHKCPLGDTRTHAVPGEGPHNAILMFIGEGPGQREDQLGRPFVGASGNLLEELLIDIGLSREQVFITNVVKCRPPGNRDPKPAELIACSEYLDRQIAHIQPKIVVTLGRFSMDRYFPGQAITRIHGQSKQIRGVYIFPLFHPAAALRSDTWRRDLKADFLKIRALLDKMGILTGSEPNDAGQLSLL